MILHFGPVDVEVELTWRAPARATVYEVFAPGVELVLKDDLLQVNRDGGFTTTTIIPSAFDDRVAPAVALAAARAAREDGVCR